MTVTEVVVVVLLVAWIPAYIRSVWRLRNHARKQQEW